MNSRTSIYILTEDKRHQSFIRGFLKRAGIKQREMIFAPIPDGHGSGKQSVLKQFPDQVRLCRRRSSRASTSLIAMMDADELSVDRCLGDLDGRLTNSGQERVDKKNDRIARVIPKWNVETWILYLTSSEANRVNVSENKNVKSTKTPEKWQELTPRAVDALWEWHRSPANCPANLLDSLARGLQEIPRALSAQR